MCRYNLAMPIRSLRDRHDTPSSLGFSEFNPMHAFFRIASRRLSDHEQGLLSQQLKMLKGRTQATWAYIGEADESDLILQRASENDSVVATLHHLQQQIRLPLEWPLRLFGLLNLLETSEQHLLSDIPTAPSTLAGQWAQLKASTAFSAGNFHCLVIPETDLFYSPIEDFDALVFTLVQQSAALQQRPSVQLSASDRLIHIFSFKRVLWALSLRESSSAPRRWPALGVEFRIGGWPLFNDWETSSMLMRLAALFTRQYASLDQAVEFSQATHSEIEAFLVACERCGLGLDIRQGEAPIQRRIETESNNLLQRLRFRLGLGTKKV